MYYNCTDKTQKCQIFFQQFILQWHCTFIQSHQSKGGQNFWWHSANGALVVDSSRYPSGGVPKISQELWPLSWDFILENLWWQDLRKTMLTTIHMMLIWGMTRGCWQSGENTDQHDTQYMWWCWRCWLTVIISDTGWRANDLRWNCLQEISKLRHPYWIRSYDIVLTCDCYRCQSMMICQCIWHVTS